MDCLNTIKIRQSSFWMIDWNEVSALQGKKWPATRQLLFRRGDDM